MWHVRVQAWAWTIAAAVLFAQGVDAPAFGFSCQSFDDVRCVGWPLGIARVQTSLGRPSSPLFNGTETWDQNVYLAANDWNDSGAHLTIVVETVSSPVDPCNVPDAPCQGVGQEGTSVIRFAPSLCGEGFFGDAVARTLLCADPRTGRILASVTVLDEDANWNAYDGPPIEGVYDIRRVILHQLGHVLGLEHPDDTGQHVVAIMNRDAGQQDRPQADDVAGLRFAYPCPGDCDGDERVTVDEILTSVAVALGEAGVTACVAADHDYDGTVTVTEIVGSIDRALSSCAPKSRRQ